MAGLVGDSVVLGLETEQAREGGGNEGGAPGLWPTTVQILPRFVFHFFPLYLLSLLTHQLFSSPVVFLQW